MDLNHESNKIKKIIQGGNLNIKIFSEHITNEPQNITRLYITSKSLGGLLLCNNGDGWTPCYPVKKNYPIKGNWFSPSTIKENDWIKAMLIKLDPNSYHDKFNNDVNLNIAIIRNGLNINSFRRHAAIGIFKNILKEEYK